MAKTQTQAAVAEATFRGGELDLGSLNQLLGFHVRMSAAAIYRDFSASLKDLDLTQKQYAVLSLINANPGCSQIALGATLDTDRATMMAIVDRLQDRRLLFRSPSKVDRRRQELNLTEDGRSVLAEATRRIEMHEQRFTSRFSAPELQQLILALRRIYGEPTGV